jgi:hypothetical protein
MAKLGKRILVALAGAFLLIQFFPVKRTNPPSDPSNSIHARMQPPPEVARILERSCRDCHSNETRWPWYSYVAPTSWLLTDHVNHARQHMNLSEWGKYDQKKTADVLDEICMQTEMKEMPLPSYLLIHRDARLSAGEIRTLCEWSKAAQEQSASKVK